MPPAAPRGSSRTSPLYIATPTPKNTTSRTAETVRARTWSMGTLALARRVGRDAVGRLHVVGEDDRRAAVGQVLLHHEGIGGLAAVIRRERQGAAGQDRLHAQARQGLADLLLVDGAGLGDRREQGARGFVGDRLVPLRGLAVLGLEFVDERLVEPLVPQLGVPPHRRQDVVDRLGAKRLAR